MNTLTKSQVSAVLSDLHRKRRSIGTRQNAVIFRLATCCGLRVSEIVGLNLSDVVVGGSKPYLRVRPETAKRGKGRKVPIWWDGATLQAVSAWKAERQAMGAGGSDPFVCSLKGGKSPMGQAVARGARLTRQTVAKRWKTCLAPLPVEDRASIHAGRHTFCSIATQGGRSLAEVRDAAGHSDVSTTNVYLHAVVDDEQVGSLFTF